MQSRFMKTAAILGLLALDLALSGCANTTPTTQDTAAGGTWSAVLAGGAGENSKLDFVTSFTVNADNSLSISGFSFLTTGACFVTAPSESGTATLTINGSNQVTGPFTYTIVSNSPAGDTLTLNGNLTGTESGSTLSGGTITGTWSLTTPAGNACSQGQCCDGNGSFTMTQT
jgi:hypothetical protein